MDIGFYHCTRSTPEAVVPKLAEKALAAGERVLVRTADREQAERIDEALWTYDAGSFLPHGRAGGDHDADQPLLIAEDFGAEEGTANGATIVMVVGGGLPPAGSVFQRVLFLFDGNDEEALGLARRHWKALAEREDTVSVYWAQGERGWEKRG